jgi:hypothetical protein
MLDDLRAVCGADVSRPDITVRFRPEDMENAKQVLIRIGHESLSLTVRDAVRVALREYAKAGKTSSNLTWAVRDALEFYGKGGKAEAVDPFPADQSNAQSGDGLETKSN